MQKSFANQGPDRKLHISQNLFLRFQVRRPITTIVSRRVCVQCRNRCESIIHLWHSCLFRVFLSLLQLLQEFTRIAGFELVGRLESSLEKYSRTIISLKSKVSYNSMISMSRTECDRKCKYLRHNKIF